MIPENPLKYKGHCQYLGKLQTKLSTEVHGASPPRKAESIKEEIMWTRNPWCVG